jgi:putative hydrolase of the HAD superfamily
MPAPRALDSDIMANSTTCDRTRQPGCGCFDHVQTWVFDLDNTLYPSRCNLFAQIDERMTGFVSNLLGMERGEARKVQKQLYHTHGTTLAGLMIEHKIEPASFLDNVHDIDYSPVPAAPELVSALENLPGRRIIFTNGSRRHAERVLERQGTTHLFSDIFDITDCKFVPKPKAEPYAAFMGKFGIDGTRAAMFEDLPQNLGPAFAHGMTTVLVHSDMDDHPIYKEIAGWGDAPPAHIHHRTDDLPGFLAGLRA